jgi:hypothetical protein
MIAVAVAAVGSLVTGLVLSTSSRPVSALAQLRGVSLFDDSTVPRVLRDPDEKAVELGVRVRFAGAGDITAVKFYKSPFNAGLHLGHVWSADGRMLAEVTFPEGASPGWQLAPLKQPVHVAAGSEYVVSYHAPRGAYSADPGYFGRALTKSGLTAPAGRNGVYAYGSSSFPTRTWRSANYYVDLLFAGDAGGPIAPPSRPTAAPTSTAAPAPTATATPIPTAGTVKPPAPTPTPPPAPPTATRTSSPGPTGFPGPTSTGARGGTLTEIRGDYHANKAGSVVKDLRIHGSLFVDADNVTVQNVEVVCAQSWWIIRDEGRNTTIQDSTLTVDRSNSANYCQYGISVGDGGKILRNDISYTPDGLVFSGDTAEVRDNWVHDQMAYPGKADHVDAAQLNGGGTGPFLFVHNHFSVPERQTGCLSLFADFGVIRNVTVQDNLFDGGGYAFYGGTDSATDVHVVGNSFGTTFFANGGYYGPVAHFNSGGKGNMWEDNRWLASGAAVGS